MRLEEDRFKTASNETKTEKVSCSTEGSEGFFELKKIDETNSDPNCIRVKRWIRRNGLSIGLKKNRK